MIQFTLCTVDNIINSWGGMHSNHPVNLSVIASIQRSEDSEFFKMNITREEAGIVFITYAGIAFYWVYPSKAERDAQYSQMVLKHGKTNIQG